MRWFWNAGRWGSVVLMAVSVSVFIGGCGSSGVTTAGTSGPVTPATPAGSRQVAPAFSGITMDGATVSSEGYKGKPTLLVFWASW
jgi:cytochrome oxidase Cu insertion factor (SCO1/SenC/PrrC family)